MLGAVHVIRLPALALFLAASGCSALLGLEEKPQSQDAGASGSLGDGEAAEGGLADTGADAKVPDAQRGRCVADEAGYHELTAVGCWDSYSVPSTLDPNPAYLGGTFDGRYAYFVSNNTGLIVRYDTTASFAANGSWVSYSPPQASQGASFSYAGAVFDGRYAYFVPATTTWPFLRYDTHADFRTEASWSAFVQTAPDPVEYDGATFDGRYLYFAPFQDDLQRNSGVVARYDTSLPFVDGTSWSSFDLVTLGGALSSNLGPFTGALFDGRYAYILPGQTATVVARLDTTGQFGAAESWALFDTSLLGSNVGGFTGGAFDGANIYLVPFYLGGTAAAFPVDEPFAVAASWMPDVPIPGTADGESGFDVAGFDGRFIYFAGGLDGLVVRTTAATFEEAAWDSFATTTVGGAGFGAAVFDGRYLYFAPALATTFLRFDAKQPASQPVLPGYFGSFF